MWDYPYDPYLAVPQSTHPARPDLVNAPGYSPTTASSVVVDPLVAVAVPTADLLAKSSDEICTNFPDNGLTYTTTPRFPSLYLGQVKRCTVSDSAALKSMHRLKINIVNYRWIVESQTGTVWYEAGDLVDEDDIACFAAIDSITRSLPAFRGGILEIRMSEAPPEHRRKHKLYGALLYFTN